MQLKSRNGTDNNQLHRQQHKFLWGVHYASCTWHDHKLNYYVLQVSLLLQRFGITVWVNSPNTKDQPSVYQWNEIFLLQRQVNSTDLLFLQIWQPIFTFPKYCSAHWIWVNMMHHDGCIHSMSRCSKTCLSHSYSTSAWKINVFLRSIHFILKILLLCSFGKALRTYISAATNGFNTRQHLKEVRTFWFPIIIKIVNIPPVTNPFLPFFIKMRCVIISRQQK